MLHHGKNHRFDYTNLLKQAVKIDVNNIACIYVKQNIFAMPIAKPRKNEKLET
jgi:hypothetical protein